MKQIKVSTARVSYRGADRLDITIKSAKTNPGLLLAPDDWNMVMSVKAGKVSWEAYSAWYKRLIYQRYLANPDAFLEILNLQEVTLLCYCTDHTRCHRSLAVDALRWIAGQHGYEFEYQGEVT